MRAIGMMVPPLSRGMKHAIRPIWRAVRNDKAKQIRSDGAMGEEKTGHRKGKGKKTLGSRHKTLARGRG
jgi:hypothetical protein